MKKLSLALSFLSACAALALPASGADAGFKPLFNGHDLTNWDGNPAVWSVKDGTITGVTQGPESLPYNQFIIWRGGTVKNFELHAKIRQTGNNSGIQYRSQEMPAIGRWSIGGYQCDIHSKVSSNGKLYEEQFRTTVAENGQSILVDPAGDRWLLAERKPVEVDSGQWHDFTIIAQGNHVIHKIDGQVTVEVWDYETGKYARRTEGLLAIQIHRGPAMNVQAKDIEIKVLPDTADKAFDRASIPASAKKLEPPATAPNAPKKA